MTMKALVPIALVLAVSGPQGEADDLAQTYRETSQRVLARALADDGAWTKLEHLTTRIGHRLSGSPGLEKADLDALKAELESEA